MFVVNGKDYKLHYTLDRLKMIESRTGKSVVGEFVQSNGALPFASVEAHFSYALVCDSDNPDAYVSPKTGVEIADKYMQEAGYIAACDMIATALQADMGFLFRRN
jgi:hypothetical protein